MEEIIDTEYEFKWIGSQVESYNIGINKSENDFYRSFEMNGTTYTVGDVAIYNNTNTRSNDRLCKIMCVYESHKSWLAAEPYRGLVRWFCKAKKGLTTTNTFANIKEVIEDHDDIDSVFISLEYLQCKCKVTYINILDSNLSITNTEDKCVHNYICKYKLRNNEYLPIFDEMTKSNVKDNLERKRKTEVICISDSDDDTQLIRSPLKNLKLSSVEKRCNTEVTPRRHSNVKRNLNDSFLNNISSVENTPTFNYSVVVEEESLKLKLRLSENQDVRVVLNKLDKEILEMHLKKLEYANKEPIETTRRSKRINSINSTPKKNLMEIVQDYKTSPRRSTRNTMRISYADYSSPKKRHYSIESEEFTRKASVERTPEKRVKEENTKSRHSTKNVLNGDASIPSKSVNSNVTQREQSCTPQKNVFTPKVNNSSAIKLIRDGTLTPHMQTRISSIKINTTPLMKARAHLHVSYMPEALPCREKEFGDIYNFLKGKLIDGCGGCMYISGVPGTGKTATVTSVIKKLQDDIYDFRYVNINGMRLTEPKQSYVEILKQLNGKTVQWEQAQTTLNNIFTKQKKKSNPIVLLIDELDILCTKRQDVVYNLLDWPSRAVTQLIVITIANTMDLPERLLMGRVTSRLGLTRLTFQPYTHKQLQEIVTKRLLGTNAFNPDAVQLVARKVASVSGDARRALDICRRAAEIAEVQGANTLVSMFHVNEALNAMITQPKVQAIKRCSRLQQLILQSVVAEVERTGVEETNFADVFAMLISISAINGFLMTSITIALKAVSYLAACRLLLTDSKQSDMDQRIILNISSDDVYYALKDD